MSNIKEYPKRNPFHQALIVVIGLAFTFGIIWTIAFGLGAFSISDDEQCNEETFLRVGLNYRRTINWDDPFKDDIIDTITILDKHNGYVQFKLINSGNVHSQKEKYLSNDCQLINL